MDFKTKALAKKCMRKQRRAQHRLLRDLNVECSEEPTQYLAICNAGLVTGLSRETLEEFIGNIVPNYRLTMLPEKSYCFVDFYSVDSSKTFYDKVHGNLRIQNSNTYFYLIYVKSIPYLEESLVNDMPPRLQLITDFVTPDEESMLMESIDWEDEDSMDLELKHRRVKHFGYKFRYDNNLADTDNPTTPIPKAYAFLQKLFEKHGCGRFTYDQITVNRYLPGQGIPPHVDTHSAFEDPILSLSLGAACVMDFKRKDKRFELDLPPRSLLVMSGEARYAWTHGICPRHNDSIRTPNGLTTRPRAPRVSFTFRKVRKSDCTCEYKEYCDSKEEIEVSEVTGRLNDREAGELERSYVHQVYEAISGHFDETRQKRWPRVAEFMDNLDAGSLLLDVGCGNGKYLNTLGDGEIFKMGCDHSQGLLGICRGRGLEVTLADSLRLPYKSGALDAVLCIAVIHHLTTEDRRRRAVSEIVRVLRPGGLALIYVWARDQSKDAVKSNYLKKKVDEEGRGPLPSGTVSRSERGLPVHKNRTEFTHSDMLVPWKRKNGQELLRFYHVFNEGELRGLCSGLPSTRINEVYYDQGNWCAVLESL